MCGLWFSICELSWKSDKEWISKGSGWSRKKRRREEGKRGDVRSHMKSEVQKVRADSTEALVSGGERSTHDDDLTNNQKAERAIKAG